jgi:NCS1 family nucleobase:cation symporter-1
VNPRALGSLVCGVAAALVGLFVPGLRFLYDYAWFVGFFLSGAVYVGLMGLSLPSDGADAAR